MVGGNHRILFFCCELEPTCEMLYFVRIGSPPNSGTGLSGLAVETSYGQGSEEACSGETTRFL
jgi:hypothetical protein